MGKPELKTVVRLRVPDGDPIEIELDMHPEDFTREMEAEAPNGLVVAEDREGKRWFCAYQSIDSVYARG